MTLHDIQTEADIKHLVDTFYKQVLVDEVIGFIFTDVAALSLEEHMPTMYAFWGSMLLGTQTYSGNPMVKHIALNKKTPLNPEHFERWLSLWESTVYQNFAGPKADEAVSRSKSIGSLMQHKIKQHS